MNLWLRVLITFIKCFFAKKTSTLAPSELSFRVMPWDCDLNIHLTNSRYLAFMDLGRIYLIATSKNFFPTILKEKWTAIMTAIDIKYIKSIPPFAKVRLVTRLIAWDDRYLYIQQQFFIKDVLYASAQIQGTFMCKGKRIHMKKLLMAVGDPDLVSPKFPDSLNSWITALKYKKDEYHATLASTPPQS